MNKIEAIGLKRSDECKDSASSFTKKQEEKNLAFYTNSVWTHPAPGGANTSAIQANAGTEGTSIC